MEREEHTAADILQAVMDEKIVPVVKIGDAAQAVPLRAALKKGGIRCMEITFRTDAAQEAIRAAASEGGAFLIGAGTVHTVEQVKQAVQAGADFIVTPGYRREVVRYCTGSRIPIIPGCATCTELEMALEDGLTFVKFFPAQAAGGIAWLKAVSDPYAMMRFLPTGGIREDNLKEYMDLPNVAACGGTWIASTDLLEKGAYAAITQNAAAAKKVVSEGGGEIE